MTSKIVLFIIIVFLLSTGCGPTRVEEGVPSATVTPLIVTSTLPIPPTFSPPAPFPSPAQPTVAPITGTTATQINVRAEPSTASNLLGMIPANTNVQILGKEPGGNWLQILYSQGIDGTGWVTAQYVVMPGGVEVPAIGVQEANPAAGNVAIAQQQLNIRSGPGTGFNSLGTLNPQDVVHLTGKDSSGTWLQIEFPNGPDGRGWVSAAFVQAKGVENVPIITEAGEVIGTGTPTQIAATPTATVVPAWMDQDSSGQPIANVIFDVAGTHTLIYSGDVSTPTGDSEDWIQFTPYSNVVLASLACQGQNALKVSLLENGQPAPVELVCGELLKGLTVQAGATYLLHVEAPQSVDELQWIPYTLTMQAYP